MEKITENTVENNYDLRTHQLHAFEALRHIDTLCKKHDIKYFLLAGTVLGAVRHKGFIPWDDDIDIGMTMENLDRFREVCKTDLPEGFRWAHPDTDPSFPRFFGKMLYNGQHCLDVFPVVRTSDNLRKRRRQWRERKLTFWIYLAKIKHKRKISRKKKLRSLMIIGTKFCSLFVTKKYLLNKADKIMRRFENENTEYYFNICSKYRHYKELIRSEWIAELQDIEFESGIFPAFRNTDAYLVHLYGDYMTLPPERLRVADHANQYFGDK